MSRKPVRFDHLSEAEQRRYVIAQLTSEANRTGILKIDAVTWVADFLIENKWHTKNASRAATALRSQGDPVSPDEKEALGVGRRVKLGEKFLNALTEKGKSDVSAAADAIAYWSWHGLHFFEGLESARSRGTDARFMVDDRFSCECAKPFVKVVLRPDQVPLFPLDQCSNWRCTCTVDSYQPEIMGKPARKPDLKKLGIKRRYESMADRGVVDPLSGGKGSKATSGIFFWIGAAVWAGVLYYWLV